MNLSIFTHRVCKAYSNIENPRINSLVKSLINYLHNYVKENHLTEKEWEYTWNFLAKMAQFTGGERNEFLLAADVLGVSQLIEILNHHRSAGEVGYALLGPFYRENAPFRERGASVASEDTVGTRVKIYGKIIDERTRKPISRAILDIWQAASNGLYETQDLNQPDMNLRGKFQADEEGGYELVALMPTPYPVPIDGPVGELLKIAKRHPLRPAHIHFIVSAPFYETLITQVFVSSDETIKTDVVFTAGEDMVGNFIKKDNYYELHYDFSLTPGISNYPQAPIK